MQRKGNNFKSCLTLWVRMGAHSGRLKATQPDSRLNWHWKKTMLRAIQIHGYCRKKIRLSSRSTIVSSCFAEYSQQKYMQLSVLTLARLFALEHHQPWPLEVDDGVDPWCYFPRGRRTTSQSLGAHSPIKFSIATISRFQPTPSLKSEVSPSHTP